MSVLADDLEGAGVEVINATRSTALECFERLSINEVATQWQTRDSTARP